MKNYLRKCFLLTVFFVAVLANNSYTQRAFYFGADQTVKLNDAVVIRLQDYVGDVQWQKSLDIINWENIAGATADTLLFIADTTTFFRAQVTAGHCDPFYSDTTMVNVYELKEGVQIIDPEELFLVSNTSELEDGIYRFIGNYQNINQGSVILGNQGEGYLRKVLDVDEEGGFLILQTEQAAMEDVFEDFFLSDSIVITLDQTRTFMYGAIPLPVEIIYMIPGAELKRDGSGFDFSEYIIFSGEVEDDEGNFVQIEAGIESGAIEFTPIIQREFNYRRFLGFPTRLNSMLLTAGGEIDAHMLLYLDCEAQISYEAKILLTKVVVFVPVGPVPVTVEMSFYLGFDADLEAQIYATAGFASNYNVDFGANYNRDLTPKWTTIWNRNATFTSYDPSFSAYGQLTAKGYVQPEIGIKITGMAGPVFSVDPYVRFFGQVNCPNLNWEVGAGIGGALDFQVGLFGYYVVDYNTDLFNWDNVIASGSYILDFDPPSILTLNATSVSSNAATIGGNITGNGGSPILDHGMVWSMQQNPDLNNNLGFTTYGEGAGEFFSNLTGLQAGTQYFYKAYATNCAGTTYGAQKSFTTTQSFTIPTVTTANITNIASTTATGGGNVTSSGGATVTTRGICYSTSPNPTIYNSKVPSGSGTGSFTAQMTGLAQNTTYHVRAYATNSQGTGYGANKSFTTTIGQAGYIAGTVTDAVTLAGISNVDVKAYQGSTLVGSALTASNGNYNLQLPVANNYTVKFTKSGYLPVNYYNVNVTLNTTTYLETVLQIDVNYSGQGNIHGTTINAANGQALPFTDLVLREGINVQSGPTIASTQSSSNGSYQFNNIDAGNYTIQASKNSYITSYKTVTSIGGQTTTNQNISLAPDLPADVISIVLTWGANPADLDAHLTGPIPGQSDRFHVYYSNMSFNHNGQLHAQLDVDDVTSYGPETMTIYIQTPGMYRFSVHDFTNRESTSSYALSNSSATVKVYSGSTLLSNFNVPGNTGGTLWTVFELNGTNITPINNMTYEANPSNIEMLSTDAELIIKLPDKSN